jgi:hypothetical protein
MEETSSVDDSGDSSSENSDSDGSESDSESGSEDGEESDDSLEVAVRRAPQKTAAELAEEEEFDRMFRQMQMETVEASRTAPRRSQQNLGRLAIPTVLPKSKNEPVEGSGAPANGIAFKLLSRDQRGKVETRHVVVPDDAVMVAKLQQRQKSQQEERQRNKEQILALHEQEQEGNSRPIIRRAVQGRDVHGNTAGGGGPGAGVGNGSPHVSGNEMGLTEFLQESSHSELRQLQEDRERRRRPAANPKPVLEPLKETVPTRERW